VPPNYAKCHRNPKSCNGGFSLSAIAKALKAVGNFAAHHYGDLAEFASGFVCVATVGTGCTVAIAAAALLKDVQDLQESHWKLTSKTLTTIGVDSAFNVAGGSLSQVGGLAAGQKVAGVELEEVTGAGGLKAVNLATNFIPSGLTFGFGFAFGGGNQW